MSALEWLQNEVAYSERFFYEAKYQEEQNGFQIEDTLERKYWEGYLDATINALAGAYGPTPLEREEKQCQE